MTAAARIYVREYPNGAFAVHEDEVEGAKVYDCRDCLDATGGVCAEHHDGWECDEDGWPLGGRRATHAPAFAGNGCAAPILAEGVITWTGTMTPPACFTCSDRARVWDGPDGETKPCPDCAVWGVWLEPQGEDWDATWDRSHEHNRPILRTSHARATAEVARRNEVSDGGTLVWIAEVRRLPEVKA